MKGKEMKKLQFVDDPGGSRATRRRAMKKTTKKAHQCEMTRREFVGGALAAGAVVYLFLLGYLTLGYEWYVSLLKG